MPTTDPQEHAPQDRREAGALAALRDVVGAENVLTDEATLDRYAASTGFAGTRAAAVVRPANRDEVRAVVRIAADTGLRLYPISRGRNWGYGDACPVTPGQTILDLSRMDRIVEVNEDLAYAVIEPGVTQGQLFGYLRERHPSLWADCTGAGPDVSIIGNVLERGFGHTPYGNRFQTVSGLEIVLASGEVLNTGMGHYAASRVRSTYPYGVGPYLDGLFTQSNFGIVTQASLWLMPAPEEVSVFIATAEGERDLGALVDALRPLRLDGTVRSVVHIGNDLRLISSGMSFPFDRLPGRSSLTDEIRARLRAEGGIARWTAVGALFGDRRQVAASERRVRRRLAGFRLRFLTERRLRTARRVARWLGATAAGKSLARRVATADALIGLNRGVPTRRFLAGAYWRRRGGIPADLAETADPARDGCRFLWLSPVLPATGADALALIDLVGPILARHDFDLFATYSLINERSLGAVLTLCFDGDDAQESERAAACYDEMFRAAAAAGYVPYRVGTGSMDALREGSTGFWDVVAALKGALDPGHVIAPGRYAPRPPD